MKYSEEHNLSAAERVLCHILLKTIYILCILVKRFPLKMVWKVEVHLYRVVSYTPRGTVLYVTKTLISSLFQNLVLCIGKLDDRIIFIIGKVVVNEKHAGFMPFTSNT